MKRIYTELFKATVAGSVGLTKAKWPGPYTVTLPGIAGGGVASLTESAAVVGGVLAPREEWDSVALDFAAAGAADLTLQVEIGTLRATGTMPEVWAVPTLKSMTTLGTFTANFNPFTGLPVATTTYRLFDLVTLNAKGQLGQVLTRVGGAEDDTPAGLVVDVSASNWIYVLIRSLGTMTGPVTCCYSPQR